MQAPLKKTNYFGSFLDQWKQDPALAPAMNATPPSGPFIMPAPTASVAQTLPSDPLNDILRALRFDGPKPLKDLVGLTGNSLSALLALAAQLQDLGLVQRQDGDTLVLTAKGVDYASAVAA